MNPTPSSPVQSTFNLNRQPRGRKSFGELLTKKGNDPNPKRSSSLSVSTNGTPQVSNGQLPPPDGKLRRTFSENVSSVLNKSKPSITFSNPPKPSSSTNEQTDSVTSSSTISGLARTNSSPSLSEPRLAGDPGVYLETPLFRADGPIMIRERVSTQGVIRSLEPEPELDACQLPPDVIGGISELIVRRYLTSRAKFDNKFASTIKAIDKHRRSHLERAKKDTIRNMAVIQNSIAMKEKARDGKPDTKSVRDGLIASSGWSWAWALDSNERPPPSSIAARRDNAEARRLARVADQSVLQDEHAMSGNNLWAVVVNFLSVTSHDKNKNMKEQGTPKRRSTVSRFISPRRKGDS